MNIETLRDRITRDGRTLTEIARVSGVGLRTLNRIVNERANPMMETVQRIEAALKRGKRN
jgi:transcriptional regulator with XRE-family HTH domain